MKNKFSYLFAVFVAAGFFGAIPVFASTVGVGGDFTTIQEAIDEASDGDVINVGDGIFQEQLIINKSIRLVGSGVASTTIQAPGSFIDPFNYGANLITITGSSTESSVSVEISGFKIAGPGPSSCGSIRSGIFVGDGADADIHDNNIVDIRDDASESGCQNGVAIYVGRKFLNTSGTASIINNTISGYQKGGIVIDNEGSSATIEGNVITGAGPVDYIAQNGIQISRGATGTISGNTILSHDYTPGGDISTGILLFNSASDVVISNNTVNANEVGVWTSIEGTLGGIAFSDISGNSRNIVADFDGGFPGDSLNEYLPWATTTEAFVNSAYVTAINDEDGGDVVQVGASLHVVGYDAFATLQEGIAAISDGGTVILSSNIVTDAEVVISKPLALEGDGFTILPEFTGSGQNNSVIELLGVDGVTVNDLSIDSIGGSGFHGVNIYKSTNVALNNVAVRNNSKFGVVVNGSVVDVTDVTTSNNGWGGINVDQGSGVTEDTTLNVGGVSQHIDESADIWKDDNSKLNVIVNDIEGQYSLTELFQGAATGTLYTLLPRYTVTYEAGENGSITGNSSQSIIQGKNGTEVTAVPDEGYRFVTWSDGSIEPTRSESNVIGDLSFTASFEEDEAGSSGSSPRSSSVAGDLNDDGLVNILDFNIIMANWGRTGAGIEGDLNTDGAVDILDFNILMANWTA